MTAALLVSVWLALLAPFQKPIVPVDPWNPVDANCETITDLNPEGPTFDMLDWLTMDADLRATSHMASAPGNDPGAYVLGTILKADRLTYLKTPSGDTWDVNLVDDLGIWAWRTEDRWNNPRSYTQFRHVGQLLVAPRLGRGGYPGMRWIGCDTAYARRIGCAPPTTYGHLGYSIGELWGPYEYDPGYGDVKGQILKLAYYYGCTKPDVESCTTVEVTWASRRYGLFSWRQYDRKAGVWTLTNAPPMTNYLESGVLTEYFPCDQETP